YPNITAIRAALWKENGEISIFDPGQGPWSFRTSPEGVGSIGRTPAVTVDELLRKSGADFVDVLKIDIEGAEKEVFENASTWIEKIRAIMIELHDRFRPGCSRALYVGTPGFDHEERHGETVILTRTDRGSSS